MSNEMKLIMESWRKSVVLAESNKKDLLEDIDYIQEVLGLDLPIQESAHIPTKVQELVIKEYVKMQDWWAPIDVLNEEGGFWNRIKDVGQGSWKLLKLMKSLVTGGAGTLRTYMKAIMRKGVGDLKSKLFGFLDIIIQKKDAWKIPNIGSMAEKIKGWVTTAYEKLDSFQGWKKAIAATSVALGVRYIMSQIQDLVDKTLEFYKGAATQAAGAAGKLLSIPGELKDMIVEKVKGFLLKIAKEIANGVGAAWGDVTAWWGWAQKIFGGLEFVTSSLESTLSFAKARGIAERFNY